MRSTLFTKSGSAASRVSREGDFIAPRLATVSSRPRSKLVQASFAVAARLSLPLARHHTSAKEPIRAATRSGCLGAVTVRPKSSVKVRRESVLSSGEGDGVPQAASSDIINIVETASESARRTLFLVNTGISAPLMSGYRSLPILTRFNPLGKHSFWHLRVQKAPEAA